MTWVTFRGVKAYVKQAVGKTQAPGLVLYQEWWGVNEQIRGLCDRFAAQGFHVVSPDLYHVAKDASEANHLMSGLDFKAAMEESAVWAEYLKSELHATRVGVTGFCMGGALTIACASTLSSPPRRLVEAGAAFYGIPDLTVFPTSSITDCPLLLNFGEKDDIKGFSDLSALKNLTDSLDRDAKSYEKAIYPGVPHAFMNEQRPEVYSPEQSAIAFEKTVAFFRKHLA